MKPFSGWRRKPDPIPAPGDDVVPVPPPVTEEPPHDRFCDLVLTGGVASGVVYPWAIVELARAYRFRNIGGTSVGAMAAALAAAAEYGRRTGYEAPFEALRRAPASLAETYGDGRTRMLSLFQTNPHGRRLIWLWGQIFSGDKRAAEDPESRCPPCGLLTRTALATFEAYRAALAIGAILGAGLTLLLLGQPMNTWPSAGTLLVVAIVALVCAGAALLLAIWHDILYGLIKNGYGLCKGGNVEHPDSNDGPPGISQWLHDGIQASAGLGDDAPPLTFRDLWTAPDHPGAERRPCGRADPPGQRAINLQVLTTNVTHGRPYRLPLLDDTSRLYFRPDELEDYFPPCVLAALVASSRPYAPAKADGSEPPQSDKTAIGLFELPAEDLPLVVAARLSLSFPLLFSAVPLWAIDYESPIGARTLRRCMFTDGGASSNFPIHLFDAAVPRWPTFGLWLDKRGPYRRVEREETKVSDGVSNQLPQEQEVWLPRFNGQGRSDSWNRFDPESEAVAPDPAPVNPDPHKDYSPVTPIRCPKSGHFAQLLGFLTGVASSATDWRDRTNFRLPHVRNRVARLLLLPGEGGLHIGMPRAQILRMAHRYGTKAGKTFVQRFSDGDGQPSQAWKEQRWIRFNLLVNALRDALNGISTGAAWSAHSLPLELAIDAATQEPGPVLWCGKCKTIKVQQAEDLHRLLHDLECLERRLQATSKAFDSRPEPELRLNPPL